MNEQQFKQRTKVFALRVIQLVEALPRGKSADVISRQLLRSATSVGANYRAACRARSHADILSKLAIVEEEADESIYWMERMLEAKLATSGALEPLIDEANQLTAMTVASIKTLRYKATNAETQPLQSKVETQPRESKAESPIFEPEPPKSKIENPKSK